MNILQWLELRDKPSSRLSSPGMAQCLPVGIGENSSFFKLDIDIGSLHTYSPAHRLKISLVTEQDFKPDMTFYGAHPARPLLL